MTQTVQFQSTPKRPRELNPTIPIGLEQITMKAMEKNPADRYNSAAEMLNDMERFRLNPSIVFDYSKFVDNQPTKFVTSLKDTKTNSTKFDKAVSKPEETPEPEIETADEEQKIEHKPSYYAIKGIIISAVVVVAVFVGLAIFRGCSTSQAKDVEIPNFVGKTLAEANADNKDNFNFVVESKYDASKELGVILEQEPAADSKLVKSGSQITLKVNGTDTNASVPYVLNYSEKDASAIIEEKSLVPKIIYVENTKTPKGYVAEVFPKAGVQTNIGSTVYIYIANGERDEKVTIPSVSGLLLSEAKTKLVNAGLTVETVYDDESKEAKDTVLSQSPLQYGKVDKGTVVTLTVSSGKGDVATVNVYVDLPTNVTESVEMTVIVDGVVDTKYSKTLVPQYNKTCTLEFTGSGTSNIVVQLDGQVYREYSIDYSTLVVTQTATHEYAVPTTAPVETQPAYTEPPVTEPPYTPVQPTDATEPSEALH